MKAEAAVRDGRTLPELLVVILLIDTPWVLTGTSALAVDERVCLEDTATAEASLDVGALVCCNGLLLAATRLTLAVLVCWGELMAGAPDAATLAEFLVLLVEL